MVRIVGSLAGVMAALTVLSVNAASFDCAKASTRIEKSICASPRLSGLDSELGEAYRAALVTDSDPGQLKSEQRTWLKFVRNECQNEDCLATAYVRRISQLVSIAKGEVERELDFDESAMSEPGTQDTPDQRVDAVQVDTTPSQRIASEGRNLRPPVEPLANSQESVSNEPALSETQPLSMSGQKPDDVRTVAPAQEPSAAPVALITGNKWIESIYHLIGLAVLVFVWVQVVKAGRRREWNKLLSHSAGFLAGMFSLGSVIEVMTPLFPASPLLSIESMAGLKFGTTAPLPTGFVLVEQTGEQRQMGAGAGLSEEHCYRNDAPTITTAEATAFKVNKALACFNSNNRLVKVAIFMPNDRDVFLRLRDQIVAELQEPGKTSGDLGIDWHRRSMGLGYTVSLWPSPIGLVLSETMESQSQVMAPEPETVPTAKPEYDPMPEYDPILDLANKLYAMGPRCPATVESQAYTNLAKVNELAQYPTARATARNLAHQTIMMLASVGCVSR